MYSCKSLILFNILFSSIKVTTYKELFSILVENNDINSWINALQKLYNDSEFRKKLIREAYQYCLENFTYQARCKKVLDFIQK